MAEEILAGSYQVMLQKELTATAREMALQLRRKQTLQHLEQLQFDEPDMIRIRRFPCGEIAELGSEPPGPTELPGGEETRASSLDPASCVYELDTLGDSHCPKEGYLTTLKPVEAWDSQTELPFSDLEPVGILDRRGHLKEISTAPLGFNLSYSAQDIESRDKSHLPNETEVRTGSHDGHVTEPNSSHSGENNEIRLNYTANTTNGVPADGGLERQKYPTSQVHSRSPSGSFTLPHLEGENVNHSLFTDLDTLVKALPARTPCCPRHGHAE
ncbi:MAG: hypothetical protein L6R36_000789 [Xanthoria steineri]|nr:MAG: hypothetical protein L6R36_000789 [Xanthoria steineri]